MHDIRASSRPGARDDQKLFIVIPVFNGWKQTRICLRTLADCKENAHIIVVDHGSTDGTKTELKAEFPNVEVVFGNDSLWWAGATNLGIRAALQMGATAVMLLNNDCYVETGTIERLLLHHRSNPEAIIAPRQSDLQGLDFEVERISSCLAFGFSTIMLPRSFVGAQEEDGLRPVKLIAGGRGVLIPSQIFARAGMFDEVSLPHYFADHDFYLRCRKLGVPLYLASAAWVKIDTARTSLASSGAPRSFNRFRKMLSDRRSHRNIQAHRALFKKHYPIKQLYPIGLFLFLLRYSLLFFAENLINRSTIRQ